MLALNNILIAIFSIIILPKCSPKDYCSADYCNNSKQHTLCKYQASEPAPHCVAYEKTIWSENERRVILDKINSRRNKIAAGEIRSLPPANSMLKLEWNNELEISAQRWADQCVRHSIPDIKDVCRDLGNIAVGQNIATIHGDAPGLMPLALVDVWYMELLNINASILLRYVPSSETDFSHYDYFTQLLWEESNQVGCGGVKFKVHGAAVDEHNKAICIKQERLEDDLEKYRTIYRLVCNFAPSGNRRNKTVYSSGPPCSRCPFGWDCDPVYKALCAQNSPVKKAPSSNIKFEQTNLVDDDATQNNIPATIVPIEGSSNFPMSTFDLKFDEKETTPQFNYFSDLYDYTRETITEQTKTNSCKDAIAVDDLVELIKKKLSDDPMIKDLLATHKSSGNESSFKDDGVAAFVDGVYSKKQIPITKRTTTSDYVNSTFLVDLIEAVIFRNSERIPAADGYSHITQPMSTVKSIKIQAELAEIKQNGDFTGHYFFPEENEESTSEITESYYDNINLPVSDLVLEDLKMETRTKDFLDDILEADTSTESTTVVTVLSPDDINFYKTRHGVMKKFLQNIVEKSRSPNL